MSGLFSTKDGLVRTALSAAISAGVAVTLLFLSCFILMMTNDPAEHAGGVSLAVLFVSAVVTGVISVRVTGNVLSGVVTGAAISLILFLISVFFFKREMSGALSLVLHLAYIATSFAGSFFGRRKRNVGIRLKRIKRKR